MSKKNYSQTVYMYEGASCVVKWNCGFSFSTVLRSLLIPVPISFNAASSSSTDG